MNKLLGQYSLVSYVHQLRCERINLGVLVWHPLFGSRLQLAKNLTRVRCIDEDVDLVRVRHDLASIAETMNTWASEGRSPLGYLSQEFRHSLVVSPPLNARIQDPSSTLERLYSSLMPPEAFMRASATTSFVKAFASRLRQTLQRIGIETIRTDFTEEDTFQPVRVAAWYKGLEASHLWRAVSLVSLHKTEDQLTLVKAVYAENVDLKALPKYRDATLGIAVQMPKPTERQAFDQALGWLRRGSQRVETFEDSNSLDAKIPDLVASA